MAHTNDESTEQFIAQVKQQITTYIDLRLQLIKANFTERLAKAFSKMATVIVVFVLIFFVILFASVLAGFYFGNVLGSLVKGFGCVTLFYMALLTAILLFKKQLFQTPITSFIIALIYEDDEA